MPDVLKGTTSWIFYARCLQLFTLKVFLQIYRNPQSNLFSITKVYKQLCTQLRVIFGCLKNVSNSYRECF